MHMDDKKHDSGENNAPEAEEVYMDEDGRTNEHALRQKLAQCRKEKEEYLAGWQRCRADAINAKQQEEARRRDIVRYAAEDIIQSLIPVLDAFRHALNGKDASDPYVQGFGHIRNQLVANLKTYGLSVIEDASIPFDTLLHESVGTIVAAKEEDDNRVLEIVENGYMLHGKVIKPAKVKVGEFKKV